MLVESVISALCFVDTVPFFKTVCPLCCCICVNVCRPKKKRKGRSSKRKSADKKKSHRKRKSRFSPVMKRQSGSPELDVDGMDEREARRLRRLQLAKNGGMLQTGGSMQGDAKVSLSVGIREPGVDDEDELGDGSEVSLEGSEEGIEDAVRCSVIYLVF